VSHCVAIFPIVNKSLGRAKAAKVTRKSGLEILFAPSPSIRSRAMTAHSIGVFLSYFATPYPLVPAYHGPSGGNSGGKAMRMVNPAEWDLSRMRDRHRAHRLLNPPTPSELIAMIEREAMSAAVSGEGFWDWQKGISMLGCGRAFAVIPICRDTFDALFNGRSGYRAQYYLSPAEGARFNGMLMKVLLEPIKRIYELDPRRSWDSVKRSIEGPWSKIWVQGDSKPFTDAPDGEFCPRRWAECANQSIWLRAPLPAVPAIDIKGTWISDLVGHYEQDPDKADRDDCLWERGFA